MPLLNAIGAVLIIAKELKQPHSIILVSGHRRYYACLSLGKKELPCEKISFNTKNEELERLLIENQYRDKTNYQRMQEAKAWDDIISKKKNENQGTRTDLKNNFVDNVPQSEDGRTRDIVAEKVGIGSGKTYDRAKSAVKKIDELKQDGNEKDAEFLKTVLNESVRGAKDLAELDSLKDISENIKDQVIKKEMPVQKRLKYLPSLNPYPTQKRSILSEIIN